MGSPLPRRIAPALVLATGCGLALNGTAPGDASTSNDAGMVAVDATDSDASDAANATGESSTCPCAPAPTAGWSGPVELFDVAAPSAPPPCDAGYGPAFDASASPVAPVASCTCNCTGPTGSACPSPPTLTFFNPSCAGGQSCGASTYGSTCTAPPSGCRGVRYDDVPSAAGTCAVAGVSKTVSPVAWGHLARACAIGPGATGCGGADVCAPARSASAPLCIRQDGDVACPSGSPYSSKSLYYTAIDDTRDCMNTCACAAKAGYCAATYDVYSNGGCGGGPAQKTITTGSCVDLGSGPLTVTLASVQAIGSICTIAASGTPTGDAKPAGPVTFCCAM